MKNMSLAQAVVLLACIAAPIVAYKLLGSPEAAAASMVVGMVLNFLLGRNEPPSEPPGPGAELRALPGGLAAGAATLALVASVALAGCGAAGLAQLDDPEFADIAAKLSKCRAEGRAALKASPDPDSQAAKDAAFGAYESCKKREGL